MFENPAELINYAVYIKGTSHITSVSRALKRDWSNSDKNITHKIKKATHKITSELKELKDSESKLNSFRKYFEKLVNESTIEDFEI